MTLHATWSTRSGSIRVLASTRADGDFHLEVDRSALDRRRRRLVDLPWTMLDEVHDVGVVHVRSPGADDGVTGDVALTHCAGAVVAVWAGDCAPVVIASDDGWIAAVHAGWRGLAAGVIEAACDALDGVAAAPERRALLGPCIHPCCYEFGVADLAAVADAVGAAEADVRGTTQWGAVALDVPAAVTAALGRRALPPPERLGGCTGCDDRWFSHRVRGERERHVVATWRDAP